MFRKCALCRNDQCPGTSLLLAVNLDKFENLMEAIEYDVKKLENSVICRTCNSLICKFYDFKSTLMKRENGCDEIDTEKKDNLQKLLVIKNQGVSQDNNDFQKICRLCLNAEKEDYKEIRSFQCELGQAICNFLPYFDLFLSVQIFICANCNDIVLKFYDFVMCCLRSFRMAEETTESDNDDPPNKKIKSEINELATETTETLASEQEVLVPLVTSKRKQVEARNNEPTSSSNPAKLKAVTTSSKLYCKKKDIIEKKMKDTSTDLYEQELSYLCQICPAVYDSFQTLLEHIEFHKKNSIFRCFKCERYIGSLFGLRKHLGSHNLDLFQVVAEGGDIQNSKITNIRLQSNLLSIDNTNSEKYVECQLCLERLPSIPFFETHMIDHLKDTEFSCLKCSYVCNVIADLRQHNKKHNISSLYREYPTFQQQYIDSAVKTESCANENQRESITEGVNCAKCSQHFNSPTDYAIHDCPKMNEYCCGHCSHVFYSLDELDDHICLSVPTKDNMELVNQNKTKTEGEEKPSQTNENPPPSNPINNQHFICTECSVEFDSTTQLSSHTCLQISSVNSSTDKTSLVCPSKSVVESKFVCVLCNKGFKFEHHLSRHACGVMKVQVSFLCPYCNMPYGKSELHHCHLSSFANMIGAHLNEKFDHNGKHRNSKLILDKIVNIIDKKIPKGTNKEVPQDEYFCVGCSYRVSKKYKFLLHINKCKKVKKCQCCPYGRKIVRNLQTHCFSENNQMIFACSHCKFAIFMEKHVETSTLMYSDDLSYIWEEKREEKINLDTKSSVKESSKAQENATICLIESDSIEENFEAKDESPIIADTVIVDSKSTDSALKISQPVPSREEEVIDLDSDSDNEFIECAENRTVYPTPIVEKVRLVDPLEASQLISQGVPIFMESNFSNMQMPLMGIPFINPPEVGEILDSNQLSDNNSNESIFITDDDNISGSEGAVVSLQQGTINDRFKSVESVVISDDDDTFEDPTQDDSTEKFCLISDVTTVTIPSTELATIPENDDCENFLIICEDEIESAQQRIDNNQKNHFIGRDSTNDALGDDCVVIEDDDDLANNASKTNTNSSKIKRPLNAFQLFAKKMRVRLKQTNPKFTWCELQTIISGNWKNLSVEEKLPFLEEARLLRKLFIQEHPELQAKYKDGIKYQKKTNSRNHGLTGT